MIFFVSNVGFEWFLNFGRDSVTLTVRDFVQEKRNSQEIPLAAWSFLPSEKRRLFEQLSSASSIYPQPGAHHGDERRSVLKCRCTRYEHQRVSSVWSGRFLIPLGKWSIGCRRRFKTGYWYPLFTNSVFRLGDGRFSRKPCSARRRWGQEKLFSNNTSLWETDKNPCIAEKSSILIKHRKSSLLCL